jgi:hypothetical protein
MASKNSVASILSMALHVVRIILWVVVVVCGVATIFLFLAIPFAERLNEIDGVSVDLDETTLGNFVEFAKIFITSFMSLYIVNRLLEILKNIIDGVPFDNMNANRLVNIARAILYAELAKLAVLVFAGVLENFISIPAGNIEYDFSLTIWIGAAISLVLAEVFREGARLREENDLTV